MVKDIILFCQAPADIQYVLSIYERDKYKAEITIFCINVEGMFNFFKSLELELKDLVFISYTGLQISYKKPIHFIKAKNTLNALYNKYFKNIHEHKIFFFSHFFDFVTFFFISKLSKSNSISFINHYDDAIKKNYFRPKKSLRLRINKSMYNFVTGINFDFYKFNNSMIIEFPIEYYNITEITENILDDIVFSKYKYSLDKVDSYSILFLEANYLDSDTYINYEETTMKILSLLKQNEYFIYLKPHPRIGYSKFIEKQVDLVVNADIPAEFISERQFDYIVGIGSSGLSYFANRKNTITISLVNLYQFKEEKIKKRAVDYLNDISSNIVFVNNFNELKKQLELT